MRRLRPWGLDAAVVLAQLALFVPFSFLRFIDGDEGDYLLAARLVVEGELPYHDFLHTQMPLLPYVYGAWSLLTGESWYAARLLSALFATALGLLLFRHLTARFGRSLALAGTGLYLSSGLVLAWLTTVKTQALSTLLLFAAFTLVERPANRQRWIAAGVLLGLAVDTRLILAGALPAFAWAAWRPRALPRLAGGVALGLAPAALFLAIDARRFVFDNLGYHAERSEGGLVGDFKQKADVVANLLGVGTPDGAQPQFLLLFIVALGAAVALRVLDGRVPLALVVAAWVGVASLAPTPAYVQYLTVAVPFLIVGAAELAARFPLARAARWSLVAAGLVYAGLGLPDVYRHLTRFDDQRIGDVHEVSRLIDANTAPGDEVLVSWPGYLYGTDAEPTPGTENAYAPHEAAAVGPERAREYHLASVEDVEGAIRAGEPRIVVVKRWHVLPPVPNWEAALNDGPYSLLEDVDSNRVWIRVDRAE